MYALFKQSSLGDAPVQPPNRGFFFFVLEVFLNMPLIDNVQQTLVEIT
jgi:hypothetical protein